MDPHKKIYKKNPDIITRKIDDEYVLIPIHKNIGNLESVFTLNDVGSFIWERINGINKVGDIYRMIREEFQVNKEDAKKDLTDFIIHLEKIKFLIQSSDPN